MKNSNKSINIALQNLSLKMKDMGPGPTLTFEEFLRETLEKPSVIIRNVFQVFHDLVSTYLGEGVDEYPDDPESIHYVFYDCSKLFVEGTDRPFFADRLFANKLMHLIRALKQGSQQNQIYIFNGPPGGGKSTFLNNLLIKFEEYTNTEAGLRYETVWKLDPASLGTVGNIQQRTLAERLARVLYRNPDQDETEEIEEPETVYQDNFIEIPCPSHDNPLLMIPKEHRATFLKDLFKGTRFEKELFSRKDYEWIFRDNPCTICSCLYRAVLDRVKSVDRVHSMLFARPYRFNRRLGEGISVFNPGDPPLPQKAINNPHYQQRINNLFRDSREVRYVFSRYAKTNNGVFAIMDVKSHNTQRLIWLHNIISEGVHKVEDIEENVSSMFLAVMNPEDQKSLDDFQSFSDRIEYIRIPYVMDINTETQIYRNTFGDRINDSFLPRVLHNFARVIISTRLNKESNALKEWISDSKKYDLYCDRNLLLLKMEIYTGYIPSWLTQEDRKKLTAQRRRRIIAESETEGAHGISGRDSIKLFNEFYSKYAKENNLINMSMLHNYFIHVRKDISELIPEGFLDSLIQMYDYTVLQEVKESLYWYNEKRISRDIQNYLFAINFDLGAEQTCTYTKEKLEITEELLEGIEKRLLGTSSSKAEHEEFRAETQKEYTSKTLTQEIMVEGKPITRTKIYEALRDRYVFHLKEAVLDPFLENENFRRAIKDYGEKEFRAYSRKIRNDVKSLIKKLQQKSGYTEQGAKEVCIYVIDKDLAKKYKTTD
ncbi:MAG: serine protein kinase PrkA [Deltaproteobacteria bacterium]|nr:serine protein kinase PrkA [Deltaproteobacteria bacterium]